MTAIESPRSFSLGRLVITASAADLLNPKDVDMALRRHAHCDWGEVCAEDAAENELSLREGFRLMSVYADRAGRRFYIITEADRAATTVLLPEDY